MSYIYTCEVCNWTSNYKNANSMAVGKHNHLSSKKHLKTLEEYKKNNSETKHITDLRNEFLQKIKILEDYVLKKGKRISQQEEELQQTKEELKQTKQELKQTKEEIQQIKEHLNMKI